MLYCYFGNRKMHILNFSGLTFLVVLSTITFVVGVKNNVCKTYFDYNIIQFSDKCYYDPDIETTDPVEIMKNHVEEVEVYNITTKDGYILTLHRIPHKNPRAVMWLQHPLGGDGITWISSGNDSFAYLAHQKGYDVWIMSNRGTNISHLHVNLTMDDFEFWDYSFHEIAIYDMRSTAKFIAEKTQGKEVVMVCHSMGCTENLIYSSLFPDEAKKYVKLFVNIATPAFFKNLSLFYRVLFHMEPFLRRILGFLKIGSVGRYDSKLFRAILPSSLYHYPLNKFVSDLVNLLSGWTPGEIDPAALVLTGRLYPRGISWKSVFHYNQIFINNGDFIMFDYGKKKNLELYNSEKPPAYSIENITVPIYLIYGDADEMATKKDNEYLYRRLPKEVTRYGKHMVTQINHIDYFVGKHRVDKVYNHVLEFLDTKIFK